jgi:hypothetical protein
MQCFFLKFGLLPGITGLICWLLIMGWLRQINFTSETSRRGDNKCELTPELRSKEIEYHNLASYRALEFYVKVMLALLGGIGYLALTKNFRDNTTRLLAELGGGIVVLVSFLFCIMSLAHQKSKIERWQRRPGLLSPLVWNETWFFVLAIVLASLVCGVLWTLKQNANM